MHSTAEAWKSLSDIPHLRVASDEPLQKYARFGIGGPADLFAETSCVDSFQAALHVAQGSGLPFVVIGGGSNLIISDEGFRGIVLRLGGNQICHDGTRVTAQSGAVLQDLVNYCNSAGLRGLETMTGIPGWVGAAVYGNAGAYGHSISERVERVRFVDGNAIREFNNEECQFHYRESTFKQNKQWIIVSCDLAMTPAEEVELQQKSAEILAVRNAKYPPDMKCAGSIFKNFLYAELPPRVAEQLPAAVVREGKVPSAYFLEQAGARGIRIGDIQVATYHANLIYNDGNGTATDLLRVIDEVKTKVREKFGLELEEEVQYVGFLGRNGHGIATI